MGDMKAQARGVGSSSGADGSDPFADLANMFETEVERMGASAEFDDGFEDEFADALAVDVARDLASASSHHKPANSAHQGWVAPRAVRLADPMEDRASYGMAGLGSVGHRSALNLQADLEQALRGLSSPANPRQSIIVETQSFAPERVVDEPVEGMSEPELDDFDKLIASELAVLHRSEVPRQPALPMSAAAALRPLPSGVDYTVAVGDGDSSDGYDDMDEEPRRGRRFLSRGMVMLGGSVAALALVGVIGFSALSSGDGSTLVASGDPLLIKADTVPFKMVPKEPGGRSIPNQNKAVYDRVAAPAGQSAPQQQALLTAAEEPIDLPPEATPGVYDDSLPGVELGDGEGLDLKDETRVETAAADASGASEIPVLEPRKVRTMAVRPDGTLMPASMPSAASSAAMSPGAGDGSTMAPAAMDVASVEASAPVETPMAAPRMPTPVATTPAAAEPAPVAAAAAPEPEPDAPVLAADPIEVAAIQPSPAPAPIAAPAASGGYYVQISSQPSEALAQKSLQSLGSRFSQVISGRSVGIQAAEIPGKGTFYRVRVAAESKAEAANLCNRLKAAGGNCFVAR
ncbi:MULTISPECIES: SPOR domain-containing protein [unclassified Aureimonas]|uniref:SPOR domain-containing protein n=1 Tax=unclassified Aureimonas TaxID=2615206 RepID=UPI000A7F93EB|nr:MULTISPECIES: SPOR domain-containing protein [unclassified Aureimonas]